MRMAKINGPKMLSGKNTLPYIPPPTKYAKGIGYRFRVYVWSMCTVFSAPRNLKENGIKKIRGDF